MRRLPIKALQQSSSSTRSAYHVRRPMIIAMPTVTTTATSAPGRPKGTTPGKLPKRKALGPSTTPSVYVMLCLFPVRLEALAYPVGGHSAAVGEGDSSGLNPLGHLWERRMGALSEQNPDGSERDGEAGLRFRQRLLVFVCRTTSTGRGSKPNPKAGRLTDYEVVI